ncbi:sensor domain-containing protein, partial [Cellulomonas sp. 179-A 9B4 NHS]|uniref:sensor domain-containing protein n=1 Tax=Cellulomonas sp. 179-A 9B4 NHS TaxID=3142379 RepID=UPI0039A23CA7
PRSRRPWGPWVLAAVLAVAVLVLVQPWVAGAPVPTPVATASGSSAPAPREPTPTAASSAGPSTADVVLDATTLPGLLLTRADVEAAVPAAEPGVSAGPPSGQTPWGLPPGGAVEPATCATAVTVVPGPPVAHDALAWANDEVRVEQDVVLLADPAAAREAFRALVTTVDGCTEYTVVDAAGGRTRWVTQPAIEGQGLLPEIVQEVTVRTGEDEPRARYVGHALVGNAIVSWTATALDPAARENAADVLGTTGEVSMMIEERVLAAVRALP